jgi:OOP family OmpA-OmpF porin
MLDKNKNNIPDEVEKYLDLNKGNVNGNLSNNTIKSNDDIFKKAIDEGYICIFFETGKSVYKSSSNDSVNFILTYLLTNPEAKMDLIGYTDEIGPNEFNKKLGLDRANYVKETLVKLGIEPYRLKAISAGEDQTYDPSSPETRSLVRKVIFRIK